MTFNGSGAGGVTLGGVLANGGGTLALVFNQAGTTQLNAPNTFTGGVTINSGTVQLGNSGALNSTTPNSVTFGGGSTGDLQLNGNSVTVPGLFTNPSVGTPVVENAAATRTLTVNNTVADTFRRVLQDGTGGAASGLSKIGGGSLVSTGGNTYPAASLISAGTLQVGTGGGSGFRLRQRRRRIGPGVRPQ